MFDILCHQHFFHPVMLCKKGLSFKKTQILSPKHVCAFPYNSITSMGQRQKPQCDIVASAHFCMFLMHFDLYSYFKIHKNPITSAPAFTFNCPFKFFQIQIQRFELSLILLFTPWYQTVVQTVQVEAKWMWSLRKKAQNLQTFFFSGLALIVMWREVEHVQGNGITPSVILHSGQPKQMMCQWLFMPLAPLHTFYTPCSPPSLVPPTCE